MVARVPSTDRPSACPGNSAHPDLFEDDAPLGLDLLGAERGVPHDVGEDVEREPEVLVGHADVERRVLLGGEGVHVAADRLHRVGDVGGAAGVGALEEQVLEEVARAELVVGLVDRARADPEADGDRAQVGHRLGDHLGARDVAHRDGITLRAGPATRGPSGLTASTDFLRHSGVVESQ